MRPSRVYRVRGIVLHRMDLGEADRVLTMITAEHGKVRAIAKGARRPGSRLVGDVDLFTEIEFMLARGRTFDIVTQASVEQGFPGLRSDVAHFARACYLGELVNALSLEAVENHAIYDLLIEGLRVIEEGGDDTDLQLTAIELLLLSHSGFLPELRSCTHCHTIVRPVENYFSFVTGGVVCPECRLQATPVRMLSVDVLKVLRFILGQPWETVKRLQVKPALLRELSNLVRGYVAYILEREPNSARFVDRVCAPDFAAALVPSSVQSPMDEAEPSSDPLTATEV